MARPEPLTMNAVKEAIRRGCPVKIDPDGTVWINEPIQHEARPDQDYDLMDMKR